MGEAGDLRVEIVTSSPEETEGLAGRLAARLRAGDVVYVSGELGAGKTTFVRGACRALGCAGPITSPTYTIGHRYDGVSHLDLYRVERLGPDDWAGLEPYFEDAICFVEWPERAAGWLPPQRVFVALQHVEARRRLVVPRTEEEDLV